MVLLLASQNRSVAAAHQKIQAKYDQTERTYKQEAFGRQLAQARREEHKALTLAADIRMLSEWMKQDVLAVAGSRCQHCHCSDASAIALKLPSKRIPRQ